VVEAILNGRVALRLPEILVDVPMKWPASGLAALIDDSAHRRVLVQYRPLYQPTCNLATSASGFLRV
jgi:hypothetical protein